MKKSVILLIVIGFLLVVMVGCAQKSVPKDLYITVSDVTDAPAGEYTLSYSINKFAEYENQYNLHVYAYVYDESNNSLPVKNNRTVTLESDKRYTVTVLVSGFIDDEQFELSAFYTIETAYVDRIVVFLDDENDLLYGPYSVAYGTNFLDRYELPEVPDIIEEEDNKTTEIVSKQWSVVINDQIVPLEESHLQNIVYNVYIYPLFEYSRQATDHTITFVTNGGSDVPVYYGNAATIPVMPDTPTKEGYSFYGWCTNEECTEFFPWANRTVLTADYTLYAKWIKNEENATADKYFTYSKQTDVYGNYYYRIAAYDAENLVGDLVLPNHYNGLPVREIAENGFKGAKIESVYIPGTYIFNLQRAFFNCAELATVTFAADSTITYVGLNTFAGCNSLTSINLPNTVERLGSSAFEGCLSLASIDLPTNLQTIDSKVFFRCMQLQSVVIPAKTETIWDSVFERCTALENLLFEENTSISYIGSNVLTETAVTEVALPTRMQEKNPFGDCGNVYVLYY